MVFDRQAVIIQDRHIHHYIHHEQQAMRKDEARAETRPKSFDVPKSLSFTVPSLQT